ncbi:MAG: glycosyltransferase [Amaricoccus sp.]|uniref:glycosyltransferase family 8 protein n=1 Tax=Amaricoccus sp. TaxID=1872485 RepID=UPI0039E41581
MAATEGVVTLDADRPAGFDRAVVFAADGAYLRHAAFAAAQLAALSPGRTFDICLCGPEMPPAVAGLAPLGLRRCRVGTAGMFDGLGLDPRRSAASYLRYALPDAFAGAYRRLLYLDADVFIQGGDFGALLEVDLGPHPLGAVRDNMQWRTPRRRTPSFARLGLPWASVFNSGMLLIDVAAWREREVLGRMLAFGAAHDPARIGLDQDLVNAVVRGAFAELSPVWNWQYTWASRLFEALDDAHVVHFIGPRKPWSHDGGELPLRFRRAYRAFFAEHFPEAPVGPDGVRPLANRGFVRRMLVKHLLSQGKLADYLDRFPDDMTVLV